MKTTSPFNRTRLYVQNVPGEITSTQLKAHFETLPGGGDDDDDDVDTSITDARVIYHASSSCLSRRFGFVGYKTYEGAKKACEYFDQSYFGTCKLNVSFAKMKGDEGMARPWSQYSKGSSRYNEMEKERRGLAKDGQNAATGGTVMADGGVDRRMKKTPMTGMEHEEGQDADREEEKQKTSTTFEEFLEAVQPRHQSKFWTNDDGINPNATKEVEGGSKMFRKELPMASSKRGMEVNKEDGDGSTSDTSSEDIESDDDDNFSSTSSKPIMSDMDYLKSKMSKNVDDTENAETIDHRTEDEEAKDKNEDHLKEIGEKAIPVTPEMSTCRLFVRNLPYTTSEDDLQEYFDAYGEIEEIHIPLDDSKRKKGFGFILFKSDASASAALAATDNQSFQGRILHVMPSEAKREVVEDTSSYTFKEKQEALRRKGGQKQSGWNASYIRSDATVDALSSRLNISKGEILDKEQGNMAVKLAIGETVLIQENKDFFIKEGVDLDALQGSELQKKKIERSSTTILLKNLPFSSEKEELLKMFGKFGEIVRMIFPPSKTLALVEFFEAADARRAFRSLAYKKYQFVPLYLEWAPTKVFFKPIASAAAPILKDNNFIPQSSNDNAASLSAAKGVDDEEEDDMQCQPSTIFVKNLNFATSEAKLQEFFEKCSNGGVRKVTIAKKKDVSNKNNDLSMGYGFIEFTSPELAQRVLSQMQGARLEGFSLELKLSQKKLIGKGIKNGPSKKKQTKITVRNIAFEATSKEVRELFSTFGKIKSVRLPKKFDGSHRGFGFVDFLTPQEAANAFSSLSSTHLYGRHLVLDWTTEQENMDTLREKASRDFASITDGSRANKRQKKDNKNNMDDDDF